MWRRTGVSTADVKEQMVTRWIAATCVLWTAMAQLADHEGPSAAESEGGRLGRDMSKAELLQLSSRRVAMGFVPPVLARQLYAQGSTVTQPWTPAIADALPSTLKGDNTRTEPRRDPHLASRRRAYGASTGSQSEQVYASTRIYGTGQGCEDFVLTVRLAGLSAASPETTDDLLTYGMPLLLQPNTTTPAVGPGGWETACGVGYALAPRSGVVLSPSFLKSPSLDSPASTWNSSGQQTWWENITLSSAAQTQIQRISVLLHQQKEKEAQEAGRHFLQEFGTHVMPGPILWGGLIVAEASSFRWKSHGEARSTQEKRRRECHLRSTLQSFGTRIACLQAEEGRGRDAGRDEKVWLPGLDESEAPVSTPLIIGGTREDQGWLESVSWQIKPSTSWQIVDRGPPLPIHLLVPVDRARGVLISTRNLIYAEYLRLWTKVNPYLVSHLARAKRLHLLRHLRDLLGISLDSCDQEVFYRCDSHEGHRNPSALTGP